MSDSTYGKNGGRASIILKPSYNCKVGKPAVSRILYYAISLMLAAAFAFSAGTMYRILNLSNNNLEVDYAHQSHSTTSPRYTTDEAVQLFDDSSDMDANDLNLPSGQHLFVDIRHVDANFLNSEDELVAAMIELVDETKDLFLSYYCRPLAPMGYICEGAWLKSRVSWVCFCSLHIIVTSKVFA